MMNKSTARRAPFSLLLLLLLLGISLVFYLSWLPDPRLSKYGFLPDWLAHWTDAEVNDNLRTAVPFLFLGFFTGCWLSVTKRGWNWWVGGLTGLVAVALIAETGQLILPHRNFDWGDVAWGAIGSLSGLSVAAVSMAGLQAGVKMSKGRWPK